MTVDGQPTITYGYDAGHGLTSITQGATVVPLTYDERTNRSGRQLRPGY
jgi:hypothetical protein